MKLIKFIPMMIFIAINLIVIVAMIFCALTAYLPPQHYPGVSYWGLAFPVFLAMNTLFIVFWLIFKPAAYAPIALSTSKAKHQKAASRYCPTTPWHSEWTTTSLWKRTASTATSKTARQTSYVCKKP